MAAKGNQVVMGKGNQVVMVKHSSTWIVVVTFCIVWCSFHCKASSEIQLRTYRHKLDNKEVISCLKCMPGFYLERDCYTDGGRAICKPCPTGTFNSKYSVARSCAPCTNECQTPGREFIAMNCTSVSNISCLCRDGYYRDSSSFGLCLSINPCPPGQGVVKQGNGSSDTVCEDCRSGYFSASKSTTEPCQACMQCPPGTVMDQDCKKVSDRSCKSDTYEEFPGEAVGGGVAAVLVLVAAVIVVCCLCVMKEKCASIRKKLCKCCYRPYKECAQFDKHTQNGSANLSDIQVKIPNGTNPPDLIPKTGAEQLSNVPDKVLYALREDLISLEYPQFFRFLFSNEADRHINEMKLNYGNHGVKEIVYQILVRWREVEKENATPENILDALSEWERQDLVQKYRQIFEQNNSLVDKTNKQRNNSRSSVSTDV